jgi:trigger factor
MLEIRRGKALAMIVESATVTDSNGSVVPLENLHEDGSLREPEAEPAEDDAAEDDEESAEPAPTTSA